MATIVTLNVFSGRQNPRWTLDDSRAGELAERLQDGRASNRRSSAALGLLGYRGFSIQRLDSRGGSEGRILLHEGIADPGAGDLSTVTDDRSLERWLLESAADHLEDPVRAHVEESLDRPPVEAEDFLSKAGGGSTCPPCNAADAVPYDPNKWNSNPHVKACNNCYAYANDQITNNFPQPGYAHSHYPYPMACNKVQPAAEADGLYPVSNFSDPLSAGQGWYVALVVAPGYDYHWYRQDSNGCWSHKPGSTAARNTDNSGNIITDPKTADRGPYTDFCSYMVTKRGLTIAGPGC